MIIYRNTVGKGSVHASDELIQLKLRFYCWFKEYQFASGGHKWNFSLPCCLP